MVKNAYIHIPFCSRKCNYCSFVSYDTIALKNDYIEALCNQIKVNYQGEKLNTLYFGGGTPSLLAIEDFNKILGLFKYDDRIEITVEINPETVDKLYLKKLKEAGINRLSIGVQVFDDEILKIIGRKHSVKDVLSTVYDAKQVGFKNISIDLIYGLPNQSIKKFKHSLAQLKDLDVQHVSLYGLKIDEGSKFYNNEPEMLPDSDEQADMYILAVDYLKKMGYEHYEISNFGKKGYSSRHNLCYWNNSNYYGFGCAASGYEGDVRYSNTKSLEEYIQNPIERQELIVTPQEKLEEEIFLGLRKLNGIDVDYINEKYAIDFNIKYRNIIDKYLASGHFKITDKGYSLTLNGILLSNNILSEFIED